MSLDPHPGVPRNVLCPYCKLACLYQALEFGRVEFENADPNLPEGDRVSVCISMNCARADCDSHVRMHSVMMESFNMRTEAKEILSKSACTNAICEELHAHNWERGKFPEIYWEVYGVNG